MGSVGWGETLVFISSTITTTITERNQSSNFPPGWRWGQKKGQTKEQWCLWVSSSGHWAGVHGKSGTQQLGEEGIMVGQVHCGIWVAAALSMSSHIIPNPRSGRTGIPKRATRETSYIWHLIIEMDVYVSSTLLSKRRMCVQLTCPATYQPPSTTLFIATKLSRHWALEPPWNDFPHYWKAQTQLLFPWRHNMCLTLPCTRVIGD